MQSTYFSDVTATSTRNISTLDDLFRLTAYLTHKKSFILDIVHTPSKDLIREDGSLYHIKNTAYTKSPMLSVLSIPFNGIERHIALIVQSKNTAADITALTDWFTQSALQGIDLKNTACVTCAIPLPYRKIPL